jgi:hypothetical protein
LKEEHRLGISVRKIGDRQIFEPKERGVSEQFRISHIRYTMVHAAHLILLG